MEHEHLQWDGGAAALEIVLQRADLAYARKEDENA